MPKQTWFGPGVQDISEASCVCSVFFLGTPSLTRSLQIPVGGRCIQLGGHLPS
jgi:hypothetical protein